jgi:hypothetical protein
LLRDAPRTGLASLNTSTWRQDIHDVEDWLKSDLTGLSPLLGAEGAKVLLRCQVHQAVARSRLPGEVASKLLARSAIAAA